jgi:hypothetical protein
MSLYRRIVEGKGKPPTEQQRRVLEHVQKTGGDIRPATTKDRELPLFGGSSLGSGARVWRFVMDGLVKRGWVTQEMRRENGRDFLFFPITPAGEEALR